MAISFNNAIIHDTTKTKKLLLNRGNIKFILIPLILFSLVASAFLEEGKLPQCPSRPNCVNSHDKKKDAKIKPIKTKLGVEDIVKELKKMDGMKHQKTKGNLIHFIHTSSTFKFKDDIHLLMTEDGVVHIRSASRVGHYDFNANKERVEKIKKILSK